MSEVKLGLPRRVGRAEIVAAIRAACPPVLFTLARRWDDDPGARATMAQAIGCCKVVVLDAALAVVDLAMRVVGGAGLARSLPLERYYRDIRPGLHNPPMEDAVLASLARQAVAAASPPPA